MPKECGHVIRSIFKEQGLSPNVQFEVSDIATIIAMVQEGVGNTILPELSIPSALSRVTASYLSPQVYQNLGLEVRPQEFMNPALNALIHEAQEFTKNLSIKLFNSYQSVIVRKR
jgi:DNA-binding transcriptional LysR family regulator